MITRQQLIKKYLDFFKEKGHKIIPSESLIPKNDPTVLFTTAGMHPLVPYLLGQKHPLGKRIANVQKCIRTTDIDAVGDSFHHTFFEMLGNWSFGDYWKKEAIEYSYEFLTKILKVKKGDLTISCFSGDKDAPRDDESAKIWKFLGIKKIKFLGKMDNWWGPAGTTGPCGPDTEMFVNGMEIWNDVFMQYNKDKRLILVDGMYCLYDENFNLNKELLGIINNFNTHTVLTVNGFREKGRSLVKSYDPTRDTNWEAFSLEEKGIKKDNPEYFKILLKRFNIIPEEVMYFDHDKKSVETAKKLGILSKQYTDVKSIKKFIENNLWTFIPLKQKNVDTGMGVERTIAILNGLKDNYLTDAWKPIIKEIENLWNIKYDTEKNKRIMRIIADHAKASVFIAAEGITPSNSGQGYILRKLIRRAHALVHEDLHGVGHLISPLVHTIMNIYHEDYEELKKTTENYNRVWEIIKNEEEKFGKMIDGGVRMFNQLTSDKKNLSGKDAFLLFQSYGFPLEITMDLCKKKKIKLDEKGFEQELKKHQELSRTASAGTFKSGLADHSEKTTRLHTATHLLNEALRRVLGSEVRQRGSNITPERLRFDFNFPRKLTNEEIRKVENVVNKKISDGLDVKRHEMSLKDALKSGAQAEFGAKYPEIVSVYTIGDFSKEICTGPHVKNTKEIGKFKIIKEESSAAGIRRIKAIVE